MKPAPFRYAPADTVDAALALLEDEEALALAGGQSLVPLLNFRLARPGLLVDLNPVAELDRLEASSGALRLGAMTRQATVLRSSAVNARWPLLARAIAHVGHAAIRSRGTVGGSVAHADPKAEIPVALCALDARFHLRSRAAQRTLGADELFVGPFATAVGPGELLVEIEVPAPPAGARMAFVEHARTHGDFAMAGVAALVAPGGRAAIALLGADVVPVRARRAERSLAEGVDPPEAARLATAEVGDEYQRALLAALAERALRQVTA